jgi:hypothetical protein
MVAMLADSYRRTGNNLAACHAGLRSRTQKRREVRALLDEIAASAAPTSGCVDLPTGLKEVLDLWLEPRLAH